MLLIEYAHISILDVYICSSFRAISPLNITTRRTGYEKHELNGAQCVGDYIVCLRSSAYFSSIVCTHISKRLSVWFSCGGHRIGLTAAHFVRILLDALANATRDLRHFIRVFECRQNLHTPHRHELYTNTHNEFCCAEMLLLKMVVVALLLAPFLGWRARAECDAVCWVGRGACLPAAGDARSSTIYTEYGRVSYSNIPSFLCFLAVCACGQTLPVVLECSI